MTHPIPTFATLDDWIARETRAFSLDDPKSFPTAIDQMVEAVGSQVELLGLGEALEQSGLLCLC